MTGSNLLIGSVGYRPEDYGKNVMELAQKMLNHEKIEQMNYTRHEWIPNPQHHWYKKISE
jgi:hypothetical protein